jgi:uncharacterized membrane protein
METPASIAKHPIHAMLVVFPIALWIFSLICDVIALTVAERDVWSVVAFYTMAGGLIGALAAAVPGFIDFFYYQGGKPPLVKVAKIHMVINLTAVAIFAVNIWLRSGESETADLHLALSVIGVVLILISSWLGGQMVHVHGVGVEGRE